METGISRNCDADHCNGTLVEPRSPDLAFSRDYYHSFVNGPAVELLENNDRQFKCGCTEKHKKSACDKPHTNMELLKPRVRNEDGSLYFDTIAQLGADAIAAEEASELSREEIEVIEDGAEAYAEKATKAMKKKARPAPATKKPAAKKLRRSLRDGKGKRR